MVALDEDNVIFFRVKFLGVRAIQPPVIAVAPDEVVAARLKFQTMERVEAGDYRQHDTEENQKSGPAANDVRQRIEKPSSHLKKAALCVAAGHVSVRRPRPVPAAFRSCCAWPPSPGSPRGPTSVRAACSNHSARRRAHGQNTGCLRP